MHQVLFYSMGGNTKRLADVIAEELGVKAADIKAALSIRQQKLSFFVLGAMGASQSKTR
jgi:flavodoxin